MDLRVRTRGAGEGSPAAWEAGTRRDHADGHGRGTQRPLKGGLFLSLFLYACCGAVSGEVNLPKCLCLYVVIIVGCIAFLPVYVHEFIALAVHTCLISLLLLYTRIGNKCAC